MQPTTGVTDLRDSATSAYSAYEALVTALARPELAGAIRERRTEREARTGVTDSEDEGFEARMRAFWDAAVTTPDLLERARPVLAPEVAAWADAFARAHRGLFRVAPGPRHEQGSAHAIVIEDVWGGAAFRLMPAPPKEIALAISSAEGLFDGRLVGRDAPLAVALLPGAVFHPPDATPAIDRVLEAARADGLDKDDVLDALLRMEARLRGHSRVKPSYAYRPESLRK